jgi:uncharacterized protein YegP (UPF0339 family)
MRSKGLEPASRVRRAPGARGEHAPAIGDRHFEFYRAKDGWRWTFWAENGRKLADGGQGYSRLIDAVNGAKAVTATHTAFAHVRGKLRQFRLHAPSTYPTTRKTSRSGSTT